MAGRLAEYCQGLLRRVVIGCCPVCGDAATIVSTTGVRAHWCPDLDRNVWWYESCFVTTTELTGEQVVDVLVHGKRLRDVVRR